MSWRLLGMAGAMLVLAGILGMPSAIHMATPALAAGKQAEKGAGKATKKAAGKLATDITADNMELQDEKNLIIFTGNVHATRGRTRLSADRLEVYTEKQKGAQGEESTRMRRWVATGNVRITKDKATITGARAVMDVPRNVVTVTGNVVVRQPNSVIRGEKLVANLKTNVTRIIAGGKRRVHGVFR